MDTALATAPCTASMRPLAIDPDLSTMKPTTSSFAALRVGSLVTETMASTRLDPGAR